MQISQTSKLIFISTLTALGGYLAGNKNAPQPAASVVEVGAPAPAAPSVEKSEAAKAAPKAAAEIAAAEPTTLTPKLEEGLMRVLQALQTNHANPMNALLGWLKEDADAAMAYLATSSKRDEIYASLFAIWSQQEPEAASGWAAQHRGQPGSDAVAAGVAKGTAKQDPASAATWVAAIKDPLIKLDAAQSAGATMFAIDETMALTELQRWNIPASGAEPMVEAWRKAFTSKAARNAQNLASTFTAARSAGANITADSIEGVLAVLQNGIKGSGAFKTTMFQLSADFSPRELAALSTQLKVDQVNNLLQFTGATAAPQ